MSMHLYDEKELGNCTDFIVAAAGVMLDIPILMVRPTQHKVMETGCVYYEFHEIKMHEQDEHLPANLHKIWLMFNGIDTFIPFMKKEIGNIINMGVVAMQQICDTYSSVKELVGHIPNQTIIKGAVSDILGHLRAATKIAATTKFNCGNVAMNLKQVFNQILIYLKKWSHINAKIQMMHRVQVQRNGLNVQTKQHKYECRSFYNS